MECPRCGAEIPRDVSGCPHCMQAIDDAYRSTQKEVKPEDVRTPLDEFILTYLARREMWILVSVVLAPLAILLGAVGLQPWIVAARSNYAEARDWCGRYLRLGSVMLVAWIAILSLRAFWPESVSPVTIDVRAVHQPVYVIPGTDQELVPRDTYEWVVVTVTASVEVPEGKKPNPRFAHEISPSQFHLVTPTGAEVPLAASDTQRLGQHALPEHTLRMGDTVSGILLFHVQAQPPATLLVYEADPNPKTGKPRFRREFNIPPLQAP